jgi:uncharacterized membrane protein
VVAIKGGKLNTHKNAMTAIFFGALIVAGLFTFFPGRLLWRVFVGD